MMSCSKSLLIRLSLNKFEMNFILCLLIFINGKIVFQSLPSIFLQKLLQIFWNYIQIVADFAFPNTILSYRFLSETVEKWMAYRHNLTRMSLESSATYTLNTIFFIYPLKHNLLQPYDKILEIVYLLKF